MHAGPAAWGSLFFIFTPYATYQSMVFWLLFFLFFVERFKICDTCIFYRSLLDFSQRTPSKNTDTSVLGHTREM